MQGIISEQMEEFWHDVAPDEMLHSLDSLMQGYLESDQSDDKFERANVFRDVVKLRRLVEIADCFRLRP